MTKKIGRNDPCPCGSGKKYKNCCLKEYVNDSQKGGKITLQSMCAVAKMGLKNLNSGVSSTKKIRAKGVKHINDVLIVEFYPFSKDSIGIKTEAGQIVAFLSALFDGEDELGDFGLTHFAVRAKDEKENEVMYVVSSMESARFIRDGLAVEWLNHSLFQDNTDETRLTQAKKMISRVEQGIRKVIIYVLEKRAGPRWWENIDEKVRNGAEKTYQNKYGEGNLPNGNELIGYSYLLGLKKIILDNWQDFNSIFKSKEAFEKDMNRLNFIRKEESHNRTICPTLIIELESIYKRLLSYIEKDFPGTIPYFLIENWRIQLAKLFDNLSKNMVNITEADRNNPKIMIGKIHRYRDLIADLKYRLENITVPPSKEDLHSELVNIISRALDALDRMISASPKKDVKEVEDAYKDHESCMMELDEFKKKYLLSEL